MKDGKVYEKIAVTIAYIQKNFETQSHMDEVAKSVALSPRQFQQLFNEWAGVSPKKFLQYISVEHTKRQLNMQDTTPFGVTDSTRLSGVNRLHDLFVTVEGMTPGEYKNGGENLIINYSYKMSLFGTVMIASTSKGVCSMVFTDDRKEALVSLQNRFPKAFFVQKIDSIQKNVFASYLFSGIKHFSEHEIKLHIRGTNFQLQVWEALLNIEAGGMTTYGNIAKNIKNPDASRAVGAAVGSNPVAYLIPCHRVIKSGGVLGKYRWGAVRKAAMIGWEVAHIKKP